MNKSESIQNLTTALLAFQTKARKIAKDSANPFFKSRYASLSNIQESIHTALAECSLVYTQLPDGDHLITLIVHTPTGEYISSSMDINAVPDQHKEKDKTGTVVWRGEYFVSPQAMGSAITYAKRYALVAMLGLNIDDEDDDGNSGSGRQAAPVTSKKELTQLTPTLQPTWQAAIDYLKEGGKIENVEKSYMLSKGDRELLLSEAI